MNKSDLRKEFIGKEVRVLGKNVEGKVIDETKNSFLVKTEANLRKRMLKQNSLFEFKLDSGNLIVDGNLILMRPEDRIKAKNMKRVQNNGNF